MDTARLGRVRWRRRGAWLWPSFALLTVLDALIEHALPPSGDSQALGAGLLSALVLNLLVVLLLSWPVGRLVRRVRPGTPDMVTRDYGGRVAILAVSVALLSLGLANRSTIDAHRRAMNDAIVRAQAYIGSRAPSAFRRNLQTVDVYPIEPGSVYRICVPAHRGSRTFCVVVRTRMPLERSVRFDGYESNATLSQGAG